MATKPIILPAWNTDGSNRVEPSAGQKTTGYTTSAIPSSSHLNWWKNNVYSWASYLNDLENQPLVWTAGLTVGTATLNSNALTVNGNGTGNGLTANGGATGLGVVGQGGAGKVGVKGTGGTGAGGDGVWGLSTQAATTGVVGENTSSGIGVHGKSVGGRAVQGISTNDTAGHFEGGGAYAVYGENKGSSGHGGRFIGAGAVCGVRGDGGSGGGEGGYFVGNGGGPGIYALGSGVNRAINAWGGPTNGTGIDSIGGGTDGIGLYAKNGGGNSKMAIYADGNVYVNSTAPASTTGFVNTVTKKNIVKCWGIIQGSVSGLGGFVVHDGFNIGSLSWGTDNPMGGEYLQINFASWMASDNYGVAGNSFTRYQASLDAVRGMHLNIQQTNQAWVRFSCYGYDGSNYGFGTSAALITFMIVGNQ